MALSRLARLALNAASASPPKEHADVCTLVATALHADCPDLAAAATRAAAAYSTAAEQEADLLSALETTS